MLVDNGIGQMSDLTRLLSPRSIAVIGGGAWCRAVVEQNRKAGYTGHIWPVHPTRSEIAGVATYASISALPAAPDAAFVGINRHATVEAVRQLQHMGAGGAVCFASGFEETGDGNDLQEQLLDAADEMPVLGPNCYGFLNYLDNTMLWPDQHGGLGVKQGVAIVTQSSNIAINMTMQNRGLPLAYMVTAGNQAQTGLSKIGKALLQDPRVTALGLHIEGLDDIIDFEALAVEARRLGKPIIVLKVGRSESARVAALTHTASLAGGDAGADALFRRLGVGRVDTLPAFIETLKLLHVTGALPSANIASLSCSGGEAGLMADHAERHQLQFPVLSQQRKDKLSALIGPLVTPSNPLDYHTQIWHDDEALVETFCLMMDLPVALTLIIIDFPRNDRCNPDDWQRVIGACAIARARTGGNLALVATMPENMPEEIAFQLVEMSIVPFCGLDEACAAVRCAADASAGSQFKTILRGRAPICAQTLSEKASKTELAQFGLHIPQSELAYGSISAAETAKAIGFPVVLKGDGFAHKTENGAVVVNLCSTAQVEMAANAMQADKFLIEQQVTDNVAEILVGVVHDPAHGFVLTLAAGGVLTELVADRQSLLMPASETMIEAALDKLKIASLIKGYRGNPPADRQSIITAVLAVQSYVEANADGLQELEVNPLICGQHRAVAADALIIREITHD